jgi:hypothetical protein
MSSVTVLSVSVPSYSSFVADARKVATLLEVINDEAIYTNSVIVCAIHTDGLDCNGYKNGEWNDVSLNRLVPWSWPGKIKIIEVYVNGILLKKDETIRFLPTGGLSPIEFKVSDGRYTTWLNGDLDGNFEVSN